MADDFEAALARALEPEKREPDRGFVRRVQARIVIEDRLAAERRALGAVLVRQLLALMAVATAIVVFARSVPPSLFERAPAAALAGLIVAFGLFVLLVGSKPEQQPSRG
jgi:hypothetical protein